MWAAKSPHWSPQNTKPSVRDKLIPKIKCGDSHYICDFMQKNDVCRVVRKIVYKPPRLVILFHHSRLVSLPRDVHQLSPSSAYAPHVQPTTITNSAAPQPRARHDCVFAPPLNRGVARPVAGMLPVTLAIAELSPRYPDGGLDCCATGAGRFSRLFCSWH